MTRTDDFREMLKRLGADTYAQTVPTYADVPRHPDGTLIYPVTTIDPDCRRLACPFCGDTAGINPDGTHRPHACS